MSEKSEKEEIRARLKGVLEAIGTPVTVKEINEHPILAPLKKDPRAWGQHLLVLANNKEIRRLSGRRWAPLKSRTVVVVAPEPKELPKMYFVLIPSEQKILLDVGGMRLPVVIE